MKRSPTKLTRQAKPIAAHERQPSGDHRRRALSLLALTMLISSVAATELSGIDVHGMDKSTPPGEDFYGFANGAWLKSATIPNEKSSIGVFDDLHDKVMQRNKEILEAAIHDPSSKLGVLYASYMDEATVDAKGAAPVIPVVKAIEGARSKAELDRVMAALQREGVDGLVDFGIELDDKRPTAYAVTLAQPALGLPSKAYYSRTDEQSQDARVAYVSYMTKLLALVGQPNAESRAHAILQFETTLAASELDRDAAHDPATTYHPVSPLALVTQSPGVDWPSYLQGLGLSATHRFVVRHPSSIASASRLWRDAPLDVLKDWLLVRSVDHYAPFLSKPFVDAHFALHGQALSGAPLNRPRWQRGVSMVSRRMGDALGHAYVAQYFPPSAKAAGEKLAASILAEYRIHIQQGEWMTPATKAKALTKLAALRPLVGYPDKWRDYSGLTLNKDDLVGNIDRTERLDYDHELSKLGKPVDRGEWMLPPVTTGGWANPVARVIVFPAASLQPPLFDPNADAAANYGAIGVIMGHEFTHQFDNNGRKYDADGQLKDWWTEKDSRQFQIQAERLVAQYDKYEPLPGLHANGRMTLNENIADLGGLVLSHDAYLASLGGSPAPVIEGMSGDQRFFLAYAQMSRSKTREEALRQQLLSDEHSIDALRVANMRNIDAWYSAFGVQPGQKLYLDEADRVKIW